MRDNQSKLQAFQPACLQGCLRPPPAYLQCLLRAFLARPSCLLSAQPGCCQSSPLAQLAVMTSLILPLQILVLHLSSVRCVLHQQRLKTCASKCSTRSCCCGRNLQFHEQTYTCAHWPCCILFSCCQDMLSTKVSL